MKRFFWTAVAIQAREEELFLLAEFGHSYRDYASRVGRFLRRSHLDELPQIVNVFRGEMSLIGPRPDDLSHARFFLRSIPGYRRRYTVRPGLSGLAQVELSYVEGREARETEEARRQAEEEAKKLEAAAK